MKKMSREEIKELIYDKARDQFDFDENFNNMIMTHSNDGEDQLIYQELKFDSLDMIEFILNIELEIGNDFHFDDEFINKEITLGKIIDYIYEYQRGDI